MMRQVRAPILRVAIEGPSMLPTLHPGEWWLARQRRRIQPGDLVVFTHPTIPGLVAVKRAIRQEPDGWWVEGDNASVSTDSRQFGPLGVERILGVLWVRYRPAPWVRSADRGRDV